jgi:hypothetical protein
VVNGVDSRLPAGRSGVEAPARKAAAAAFIHMIHRRVGRELPGPEHASAPDSAAAAAQPAPPGEFLSDELESDCARFLEHAKELARRRAEVLGEADARL